MVFTPAMLAADTRVEPYRRRSVNFRYGRYLIGVRSGFRQDYARHCTDPRGGGRRRGRWEATEVTRPGLLLTLCRVCCSHRFICCADLGLGAAHASSRKDAFLFGCAVCFIVRFALTAVSDYACLPTSVRFTVVTECYEVRVSSTTRVEEGVSTPLE